MVFVSIMSVNFDGGGRRNGKNTGFMAAIGLCIAAVCLVAAATAINNNFGKKQQDDYMTGYISESTDGAWLGVEEDSSEAESLVDEQVIDVSLSENATDEAADDITEADAPAEQPESEAVSAPTVDAVPLDFAEDEAVSASANVSYRMPIKGDVAKTYSGDELVYCATMCDWRVHQGIDINGTLGSEVYAAADGVVVDFIEDVLFGYTAIIRQADESMLYYCGLTSEPMVTKGLEVHAGDVIGHLGVVPCEAEEPPHLHLALMKDGAFVNPATNMGL